MRRQEILLLAAGLVLLILAAFFSISIISYILPPRAQSGGLVFGMGRFLGSAYGFCSVFIPAFFLAAAIQCFTRTWSVRKGFYLCVSVIPFFTAAVTERICRSALTQETGVFLVIKIFSTLLIGILVILLEIAIIRLFGEVVEDKAKFREFRKSLVNLKSPSFWKRKIVAAFNPQDFPDESPDDEFEVGDGKKKIDDIEPNFSIDFSKPPEPVAPAEKINWRNELASTGAELAIFPNPLEDMAEAEESEKSAEESQNHGEVQTNPAESPQVQGENFQFQFEGHQDSPESGADAGGSNSNPAEEAQVQQEASAASCEEPEIGGGEVQDTLVQTEEPEIPQDDELPSAVVGQAADDGNPAAAGAEQDANGGVRDEEADARQEIDEDFFDIDMNAEDEEEIAQRAAELEAAYNQSPVNVERRNLFERMNADIMAEVNSEPAEEFQREFEAEVPQEFAQSHPQIQGEVYERGVEIPPEAGSAGASSEDGADEGSFDGGIPDENFSTDAREENFPDENPDDDYIEDSASEDDGMAEEESGTEGASEFAQAAPLPQTGQAQIPLAVPHRQVYGPYEVPAELLREYPENECNVIDEQTKEAGNDLLEVLNEFKISVKVTGIRKGPVVTMFELLPAPGVKLSKIVGLQDNIALRLAAPSIRIVAPIPGKQAVGIEVPNRVREIVGFREIIARELPQFKKMAVPVVLGKDIEGDPQIIDLAKTPHLLIAGTTGAGKSVCVNSLILSLLYKRSPQQVKLIMVDPKIVELKLYNDIPHLLTPVITEPKRALQALQYCVCEMERRYALLNSMGVRDILTYNQRIVERRIATEKLPYIVVIIDEFADLMATTGKELEQIVARLAAKSRAIGIHMVLATQRPSVDVITGIIKANFPSRIAFMVASKMDSRIIIDQIGAEKLLGRGDMLYAGVVDPFPVRIQGTFIADEEVESVVEFVKQYGEPDYIDDEIFIDDDEEDSGAGDVFVEGEDPLYDQALDIVVQAGKASASYIQRRLKIGYNRAARLVEMMEERGIVGPANGSKPRELIHIP